MTINSNGTLLDITQPVVMGILNITPDSFYAGSRKQTDSEIERRAIEIVEQGGKIIDAGAFSTRPGAAQVDCKEEMERLRRGLAIVRKAVPDAIISVDTFRPEVARMAVGEFGAAIINDVSEGGVTGVAGVPLEPEGGDCPEIFRTVAELGVAYILMSVKPNLEQMMKAFARKTAMLHELGVKDIILDPGFGFGKDLEENYTLMGQLDRLHELNLPLLVGVSRKSMIYKLSGTTPAEALNGTTVLHTVAVEKGANILRVHDVKEAVEVCRMCAMMHR